MAVVQRHIHLLIIDKLLIVRHFISLSTYKVASCLCYFIATCDFTHFKSRLFLDTFGKLLDKKYIRVVKTGFHFDEINLIIAD